MLGGAGSPADELLTVTVARDEHGYGMKISGENPVYVQSVKELGAAWRAGLRAGDRIVRVDGVPVHTHSHHQVVLMIRENPTAVLTVHQHTQRHKTPITAPVPVNSEKQRQLEYTKVNTFRLMLEKEQKYINDLRNELLKVPDVRKQAQLESAEMRCAKLQREIDVIVATQPTDQPGTPRLTRNKINDKPTGSPPPNTTSFLSGLPRSLSNLTGQSLRNLRQKQNNKTQQENQPPLVRQNSDETNNKRRHNNTVPMVPTTCLDNVTPPPLPPRSFRNPLAPNPSPVNPLAKPKPCTSVSPSHKYYPHPYKSMSPMHQSMPSPQSREDRLNQFRRSSHSLDGDLEGPQPNSIALQMSYPLVNAPPPPLQNDNRGSVPVLHARSQSSPEHLDHGLPRGEEKDVRWERGTPPPGTPPPPYAHNTQPCSDPQRAIISMEEDDSPASDTSTYSGLFSNLRTVRDSKARTAVLLNWLIGERRCACANLLLIITDGYRSAAGVGLGTLRRWAYEIQSTFLIPSAVLHFNGVDENIANEIEHVLTNEYEKEELLRNVFRKARQKAKEQLTQQLTEFQVKRQVGLGTLYGPEDAVLDKCDVDKAQEVIVVERLMSSCLSSATSCRVSTAAQEALHAALITAAHCLHCRAAVVAAAAGGARAAFLQRDKLYKQRVKLLAKQNPQPFVVRGHHLQLCALTSVAHCHVCELVIWGLAPQAYVCADCNLRVHLGCARSVEEPCCLDTEHHNNRISRFMERIHNNQALGQDSNEKKSKKTSSTGHFLNMERSFRKTEDEPTWEQLPSVAQGEAKREGSSEEPSAPDPDLDTNDSKDQPDKDNNWRTPPPGGAGARGVNRAESCRERDAPRRGKHRNASDPNRLTAHPNHDLEPGAPAAPSGSSSSSSLSSRSNESNTVAAEQQGSHSDWSEDEEPLAQQWADSLPPNALEALVLTAAQRKQQEVIHELIVSEVSHVRWLRVLRGVFLRPLQHSALLPADELRALFPNLPNVLDRHVRLLAELRRVRSAQSPLVPAGAVAAALLNTLGESGYAACLAKFCGGQRLALAALRARRRKHKELHALLSARELEPACGRLRLADLLPCVWQRLTKYQLLLESILATMVEGEDADSTESKDVAALRLALRTAKDVLHTVDTAIRQTENKHRLSTIQSKLEVRASGAEGEELRRLDLTAHDLRMEGELALRVDSNKKISVLALALEHALVLLQREGDRFVVRPVPQGGGPPLAPLVRWDKVLFRPNAAVRNAFFLMNINSVQMHELSANSPAEYATWVKHIQEAPLAKLTDPKPHVPRRPDEVSNVNVSRNPSDASEKSSSTAAAEDVASEQNLEPSEVEPSGAEHAAESEARLGEDTSEAKTSGERTSEERASDERSDETEDDREAIVGRRPTVGRVSRHPGGVLAPRGSVRVSDPLAGAQLERAQRVYTHEERLRRLDAIIWAAQAAKSESVAALLDLEPGQLRQLGELAVADGEGDVDVSRELNLQPELPEVASDELDMHKFLLAAYTQATQLTEELTRALSVPVADVVAARSGLCDRCRGHESQAPAAPVSPAAPASPLDPRLLSELGVSPEVSSELLPTAGEPPRELYGHAASSCASDARLAARLVPLARGLCAALGPALGALPAARARHRHWLHAHRTCAGHHTVEDHLPKDSAEQTIQEHPSNGG